jgi:hypothetical protein
MFIMWDNALINVSGYGGNAEKQTKKVGASGKSQVMPNSKISKLLYARHAVRKHVYVPKDVSKFGNRYVDVLIPIEIAGRIKEYVFSFVVAIDNTRKYSDELYTTE